jgi:hypothetical protein
MRRRQTSSSTAVVAVALLAMLAAFSGCTSSSRRSSTPSTGSTTGSSAGAASSTVQVAGLPVSRPVVVRDQGTVPAPASGSHFVSRLYALTPSGRLPGRVRVTLALLHPVPADSTVVIATRETAHQPWRYLPAEVTYDRRHVRFQTSHFSLFGALLLDVGQLAEAFKKDFIDGITGGVTATADQPVCADGHAARSDGFTITSSSSKTVYWCFGIEGGTRVLKVTNRRPYPLEVHHPNMAVLDNPTDRELASLSRKVSGRYAIVTPRETATFNADLVPGQSEGISTEFDGLGQSLYALQVGVESLLKILTRFGAGGPKAAEVLEALSTTHSCLAALMNGSGSGALISGCLSAQDLFDAFGTKAILIAPLMVTGPIVEFFDSEVEALVSQFTGSDKYQVLIRRAASPTPSSAGLDVIAPGRLGPLTVGMSAQQAMSLGLVKPNTTGVCGERWSPTDPVDRRLVMLEFRDNNPDDLDDIQVATPDNYGDAKHSTLSPVHTVEGARIGTTEASLRSLYGSRLHRGTFDAEGGPYQADVLFGPSGALLFLISASTAGVPSVYSMTATAGTSMADVAPGPGGC